jgi:organic hydroperoxide reductase OsmC/OhrA
MSLEMKTSCEQCSLPLATGDDARICSYECTYCPACSARLGLRCRTCGGELVARPRRGRVSERTVGAVHHATVVWQRADATFVDRRYSRAHAWRFDGGVEVRASSSPHVVPAPLSDPNAVDPEEAFIASLASCHMLWFLDLAARAGWVVEQYEDRAEGTLTVVTVDAAKGVAPGEVPAQVREPYPVLGRVTLRPRVTFAPGSTAPSDVVVAQLHHDAHERCFLSSALKTAPRVELDLTARECGRSTANGDV